MATDKNIENQILDEELENDESVYVHKFAKPFEYDGIKYEELTFDWNSLTGYDFISISSEIGATGGMVLMPALDAKFQLRVASRACTPRIGTDVLSALPFKDLMTIMNKAKFFMIRSE